MGSSIERNPDYGYAQAPIRCPGCGAFDYPPFDPCPTCGHLNPELILVPDDYYATRTGGRGRGALHRRRDWYHIANLPDEDVIAAALVTFDDEQARCGDCWHSV